MTVEELENDMGYEFWKSDTGQHFVSACHELMELGMSKEQAIEFVDSIRASVAAEYGD